MNGLYIHIPFCRQKCKYCDFVSFAGKEETADEYIKALGREMEEYRGEKVDTIFMGGGTPSLLTAEQIRKVCKMCFDVFEVSKDYEFTIEVNPGTIDDEKLLAIKDSGINRISVGVQSFNDNELKAIGRIHDAKTAYNTICHLEKMGFLNINIDIMTALPSQTLESLKHTLKTAVSLPVTHISAYSLILEEGTVLEREYSRGELTLLSEDEDRDMYAYTVDFLREHGFLQYEISNFAKKDCECRHNIKYWTGENYIGIGTAAHSFDGDKRYYNTSDLRAYINGAKREIICLTREDKISEYIITALRMTKGISETEFFNRFSVDIKDIYGKELNKFIELDLMRYDNGRYFLSRKGIDVSNSVLCEFV